MTISGFQIVSPGLKLLTPSSHLFYQYQVWLSVRYLNSFFVIIHCLIWQAKTIMFLFFFFLIVACLLVFKEDFVSVLCRLTEVKIVVSS